MTQTEAEVSDHSLGRKAAACKVVRGRGRVKVHRSVRISNADWELAKWIARRDYGLDVGDFVGLLVRNHEQKRWPLDGSL